MKTGPVGAHVKSKTSTEAEELHGLYLSPKLVGYPGSAIALHFRKALCTKFLAKLRSETSCFFWEWLTVLMKRGVPFQRWARHSSPFHFRWGSGKIQRAKRLPYLMICSKFIFITFRLERWTVYCCFLHTLGPVSTNQTAVRGIPVLLLLQYPGLFVRVFFPWCARKCLALCGVIIFSFFWICFFPNKPQMETCIIWTLW